MGTKQSSTRTRVFSLAIFAHGPRPKICGLPHPDDGFICCESNALALAQVMANVSLVDQRAYRHETKGRMAEWMGRDLNRNPYNESQDSYVVLREAQERKELINLSSNRAESALSKCEEPEGKIERLERRIAEMEQQHPSSMDEMIDRGALSKRDGRHRRARPSRHQGRVQAWPFKAFRSYLLEVPADKKWIVFPGPMTTLV
ncbi:hypothetical protein Dimus_012952 [Dionaea muscipula]